MNATASVYILARDRRECDVLERALGAHGAAMGVRVEVRDTLPDRAERASACAGILSLGAAPKLPEDVAVIVIPLPCRLGAIIDKIGRISRAYSKQQMVSGIQIGPYKLDAMLNTLIDPAGEVIRITDKEKDILVALYERAPEALERQALLDKVWAYAEGVETHTLETHIYRLRQKIERDPANPGLLVTADEGYSLKV